MNKTIKRIIMVLMIMAVVFTLTSCGGGYERENEYGGKTYTNIRLKTQPHRFGLFKMHEKFPSDKVPVLGGGFVRTYEAQYDKNDKLVSVRLYANTKKSPQETAQEYKSFYKDYAELTADKSRVNEYNENLTFYKYIALKENYIYIVKINRPANAKYSKIQITMREKPATVQINKPEDLKRY